MIGSILPDDAGGLFQIDPATGVVTVAPGTTIDYETDTSHTIEVTATSTDGSTSAQSFVIGVTDDTSEFTVSAVTDTDAAANSVAENATGGTVVGVTAFASDADGSDTVSYSLSDDAGGLFQIDPTTGVVTVAPGATVVVSAYERVTNWAVHDGRIYVAQLTWDLGDKNQVLFEDLLVGRTAGGITQEHEIAVLLVLLAIGEYA